jgi:hypothetical protein
MELGCLPYSIVDLSQLKVKVDDDESYSPLGKGNDHNQQILNNENPFGSRLVFYIPNIVWVQQNQILTTYIGHDNPLRP